MRKIPRVFRYSNSKVSGLITLVGAPDNRITVLYEQALTPRGNDHSRYLNSVITAHLLMILTSLKVIVHS